jgi:uncharacterized protein (TIGR02453 family)
MASDRHFTPQTFAFLKELAANNSRPWFEKNKPRYEEHVKDPALRFIADFAPHLRKVSPRFLADPRPVGGSLFRIYRDTRFSKDKSPYKTYTGIQFRHEKAKDVHAPGFYLHLQPGQIFAGVGIWHPDSTALKKIRDALVDDPAAWKRAVRGKAFTSRLELAGDSLQRHPRGYEPEHPLIEDLKRKDFIGVCRLTQRTVTRPGFPKDLGEICRSGAPLVKFLCKAVDVPF